MDALPANGFSIGFSSWAPRSSARRVDHASNTAALCWANANPFHALTDPSETLPANSGFCFLLVEMIGVTKAAAGAGTAGAAADAGELTGINVNRPGSSGPISSVDDASANISLLSEACS